MLSLLPFFFNDTATTDIYTTTDTLSLHDALPIYRGSRPPGAPSMARCWLGCNRSEEHTSELQSPVVISYAVFCLKKKKDGVEEAVVRVKGEKESEEECVKSG